MQIAFCYTGEVHSEKSEEWQIFQKADLEIHNKDGGLWVVILNMSIM